ncbi:ABC transporter ATP-binding protein [Fontimonas sp. SYSU GA230001]|uniref:ABC transporter ATP-binding protein n=1 Tax=Fontimonas sp. SYSU GA230001 TaxID=3142450 RepID=UPI0032B3B02F
MIDIEQLHKRYPGAARPALAGLDLRVPDGCVFGLLGPNGAGKTTLISILTTTLSADRGRVVIDGCDVATQAAAVRARVAYAPQELAFYPGLSVSENLELFAALTPGASAETVAAAIRIGDLSAHLDKRALSLSGGLKRRLNFCIALLGKPRLLCLDEPTAGVDPQSRNFLLDAVLRLRATGVTVLYSTHYMEEVERVCDRVAILDEGRLLACDTPDALRARPDERLESVFLRLTDTALRDG